METACDENIIDINQKNDYTKKFLKLLKIDKNIVPWLINNTTT
jgi:hypothetical protein